MTLQNLVLKIDDALYRMCRAFGGHVFDEYAVFELRGSEVKILHYAGPRADSFAQEFARDVSLLTDELVGGDQYPGFFHFSREAVGSLFDAFMAVGEHAFVAFNNTDLTMADITAHPVWTRVQVHFVGLSEAVQTDPLQCK